MRLSGGDLSTVETLRPGARASRAGPRRLRDRRARVARQAQPGDAAAAVSRVAGGAGARAVCARRSRAATSPASGCRRSAGCSSRSRRARPRRGDQRAGGDQPGGRGVAGPAAARRPGSAHPRRPRRSRWPAARSRPMSTLAESGAASSSRADSGDANRKARRDVAIAVRHIADPRFRRLLIPLLYDPAPEVADEAMESVRAAGTGDFVFVPALITLLRNRVLKGRARAVLVGYGEPVVDALAHLHARSGRGHLGPPPHPGDDRRRFRARSQSTCWSPALEEQDGFLRYKIVAALERLRREHGDVHVPARADRGARVSEREPLLQLPVAARQPVRQAGSSDATRCSADALDAEDGADQGPDLPAAGADLSVEGHRRRRVDAASTATRAAARARRNISTTSSAASCGSGSCRCSRICRPTRRSGAATCCSSRVRATSRKRCCS